MPENCVTLGGGMEEESVGTTAKNLIIWPLYRHYVNNFYTQLTY